MNAPFPNFVTAQLAYDRHLPEGRWHSEADRQEYIDKRSAELAEQIKADVMRFDAEAIEIAGDLFGCLEPETSAVILRLLLVDDPKAHHLARQQVLVEYDKTVKNTAEHRAIRAVEAGE